MEAYVSQASDVKGQLIPLIIIAAALGLGKGGVPGLATAAAAATVATAPVDVPGGLGFAVALQVPVLTAIDISAAWLHRYALDLPTVWTILPLSFVGMAVGQALDRRMSDAVARLAVGVFLLVILALRAFEGRSNNGHGSEKKRKDSDDYCVGGGNEGDLENGSRTSSSGARESPLMMEKPTFVDDSSKDVDYTLYEESGTNRVTSMASLGWACAVGLVGGAATMLTNSMGPILNVYLLSVRKLSPSSYVGTRAVFFCFLNLGKIPMRFASGTLGWAMMPLASALGAVSVVCVYLARPIMMNMNEATFVRLELAVVAIAGVRLCWMGLMGL